MGKHSRLLGYTVIEFESADPMVILQLFSKNKISVKNISWRDDFTVQFHISSQQILPVLRILQKRAENHRIVEKSWMQQHTLMLLHRPILLLYLCLMIFLSFYLPSRVLFVQVEGNAIIPDRTITEAAWDCGIRFGASRKAVRSEIVKNEMIARIPQLKWVGVNTKGCVAVLSVREGVVESTVKEQYPVGNVIANRDGVILSCTTLRGTPICKPGQAVTKGELLISGYTDCGIYVQATCAEGEILAQTTHQIRMVTPGKYRYRQHYLKTKRQYRLKIGNYIINLYKGSGISDTTCVKIYEEKNLCLPGGFSLPVSLICEKYLYYQDGDRKTQPSWLSESAQDYLKKQMVAGTIISEEIQFTTTEDIICLSGRYDCTEMIGQIKYEESANVYGYDGENR